MWWFFTAFYSFRQNIPPIRHHSFLILTELQTYGKIQSVYVEFSPTTPLIDNHSHLARLDNDNHSHLRQRHFSTYFLHISTYFYSILHLLTLFDISSTHFYIYPHYSTYHLHNSTYINKLSTHFYNVLHTPTIFDNPFTWYDNSPTYICIFLRNSTNKLWISCW